MSIKSHGPHFQIESRKAFVIGGHSERSTTGEFLARTLLARGIFEEIEVVTLNRTASLIHRGALRREMLNRTVITHSAAIIRVPAALQIVAINPPEQVSFVDLLKRANEIIKDKFPIEEGAHKTGYGDLAAAGVQLLGSPVTSLVTPIRIAKGYSSVDRLVAGADDFPAGRAIVHSEFDGFGFYNLADMGRASSSGVTTLVLPNHYHGEVLFAPNRTIDLMTPAIFSES